MAASCCAKYNGKMSETGDADGKEEKEQQRKSSRGYWGVGCALWYDALRLNTKGEEQVSNLIKLSKKTILRVVI